MAWVDDLKADVDGVFNIAFDERDGRKVPTSEDVALRNGAVKLEATFLYADLAGSGQIASACPWGTTAKIIRAYLKCATRLIRAYGGEIRSYDGDRVMGVFIDDAMSSNAAQCAREIYWTTENIIQPKAINKFDSVRNNGVKIRQACGIDVGTTRAVRAGIRDNNDLIWIGKAPSMSAKLSDLREYPYCSFISQAVYSRLSDTAKNPEGKVIWEKDTFTFAGKTETIYRSNWMKRP